MVDAENNLNICIVRRNCIIICCAFKNLLHFQKPWFGQELEGGRLMRALDEIQMGEHSRSELIPIACKEFDNKMHAQQV